MLLGIGIVGTLAASISAHFIESDESSDGEQLREQIARLEHVHDRLDRIEQTQRRIERLLQENRT